MIKIPKYLIFIRESKYDKIEMNQEFEHFSGGPLQPWESGLSSKMEELIDINDNFLGDRIDGKKSMRHNIKIYDQPEFDEISHKTQMLNSSIYELWDEFLFARIEDFCDEMKEKYSWFKKWSVEGRQGGWLVVETDINDIRDEVWDLFSDYRFIKKDINFPLNLEASKEIEQYFDDPELWEFMIGKPEILIELDLDSLEINLESIIKKLKKICEEILEFEDIIKKSKLKVSSDFIKYMNI